MKNKVVAVIAILGITTLNLFAQSTEQNSEEKQPIYLKVNGASSGYYNPATGMNQGGSFPSYSFRVGEEGESISVGFTGESLRPYLLSNAAAINELNTFKRKRVNMVAGVGVMFAGVAVVVAKGTEKTGESTFDPRSGENVEKHKITTAGVLGIGMAVTGLIMTAVNGNGATKHVERAVSLYNEGLNDSSAALQFRIKPSLNYNSVGATLSLSW